MQVFASTSRFGVVLGFWVSCCLCRFSGGDLMVVCALVCWGWVVCASGISGCGLTVIVLGVVAVVCVCGWYFGLGVGSLWLFGCGL